MAIITVGFNQVGQFDSWYNPDNEEWEQLYFEECALVQPYTLPADLEGSVTVYYYRYFDNFGQVWGIPILYGDNGRGQIEKLSQDEPVFDLDCPSEDGARWVSGTLRVKRLITAGSKIWFGMYSSFLCPRFTEGGMPVYRFDFSTERPPEYMPQLWHREEMKRMRFSLYFTYSDVPPAVVHECKVFAAASMIDERRAWRRVVCAVLSRCGVFETTNFWRLIRYLCECIAGLRETCARFLFFCVVVRSIASMKTDVGLRRFLQRVVTVGMGMRERFLLRKQLHRIEVRLYSPICTILVLKSLV